MGKHKKKKIFIKGAISPSFIAEQISKHSRKTNIGAHTIFLGQVRADSIEGKTVKAIEYSCYEEMAISELNKIREDAFSKFELSCLHIFHSIGRVRAGKVSLFVFVSSQHRKNVFDACSEIVEKIKSNVPIWGKEILSRSGRDPCLPDRQASSGGEDESYIWKKNK